MYIPIIAIVNPYNDQHAAILLLTLIINSKIRRVNFQYKIRACIYALSREIFTCVIDPGNVWYSACKYRVQQHPPCLQYQCIYTRTHASCVRV